MNEENSFLDSGRTGVAKKHPSGYRIVMFWDEPGVYYDTLGAPANEEQARDAGFDVAPLARERTKQEQLAEAKRKIEQEYASESKRIHEGEPAPAPTPPEAEGLVRIVRISRGVFNVVEVANETVLLEGVSRQQAESFVMEVNARGEVFDHSEGSA
jgi:hypothetical protein